jgi:hypothetical protein
MPESVKFSLAITIIFTCSAQITAIINILLFITVNVIYITGTPLQIFLQLLEIIPFGSQTSFGPSRYSFHNHYDVQAKK